MSIYSADTTLGGSREKMFKLRPYESASEAIRDHRNYIKFMASEVVITQMVHPWWLRLAM